MNGRYRPSLRFGMVAVTMPGRVSMYNGRHGRPVPRPQHTAKRNLGNSMMKHSRILYSASTCIPIITNAKQSP